MEKDNIHTTVGVYPNGSMVLNGVRPEDLEEHINVNLKYRPGRVLIVDGVVKNEGFCFKALTNDRVIEEAMQLKAKEFSNIYR